MKERGIPFMAPMVRAVQAELKTQTRRPVKGMALEWLGPDGFTPEFVAMPENHLCPYGVPGDRLWVRENWRTVEAADKTPPRDLTAAHRIWFEADAPHQPGFGKFRPGMFMCRWMSRILLEVVSVRVERLQDISEADAKAEGCDPMVVLPEWSAQDLALIDLPLAEVNNPYRNGYAILWNAINGAGSWDLNPWVWVVVFKRITP